MFQVYCSWGGMLAVSSKPFYEGLKFRKGGESSDAVEGECDASECSLFCQDMWKRGYHKIVIDPQIKVFYSAEQTILSTNLTKGWFDPDPPPSNLQSIQKIDWIQNAPTQVFCFPFTENVDTTR